MKHIIETFKTIGVPEVGIVPYKNCDIINSKLAQRIPFSPRSVIIGIVPYYTKFCDEPHSVSAYALAYDYHILLQDICKKAIERLQSLYPSAQFAAFADHSPIHEKNAAAKAGLGIIGDHSLLITENFSSFVFLFDIITDAELDATVNEIKYCEHCGACKTACPTDIKNKNICLSAITQKKGELSDLEKSFIKNANTAWGCDRCQLACPHTRQAILNKTIYSKIDWFNSNILTNPDETTISDAEDFKLRAYSWRGKSTILRNISILNHH